MVSPAPMVLRLGPLSTRIRRRPLLMIVGLLLVVMAMLFLALIVGPGGSAPASALHPLTPQAGSAERLAFEWRASRAVAAALFGACLAISGAIFQTLTRNPLGSPDIIGLGAGSYAGVVAVIMVGGVSFTATAAGAVGGGVLAAALVYLLAFKQGIQGFRLIVVGIAVGAILRAMTSWFSVQADLDAALRAAIWDAGTLNEMTWSRLAIAGFPILLAWLSLPAIARVLPLLEVGDDTAGSLGLQVEVAKAGLVVMGVVFTALVTAVTGPISFIALASPQIARRLIGGGSSGSLVASALVGATLLGGADLLAQYLLPGTRLPVGGVTVVIGGSYLLWLLIREGRRI